MATKQIHRTNVFKIAPGDIPHFTETYKTMAADAKKDGKPYFLDIKVGPTNPEDPRNDGYTFAAMIRFASMADMKYYDEDCEAHKELKRKIKGMFSGILTVYIEDAIGSA